MGLIPSGVNADSRGDFQSVKSLNLWSALQRSVQSQSGQPMGARRVPSRAIQGQLVPPHAFRPCLSSRRQGCGRVSLSGARVRCASFPSLRAGLWPVPVHGRAARPSVGHRRLISVRPNVLRFFGVHSPELALDTAAHGPPIPGFLPRPHAARSFGSRARLQSAIVKVNLAPTLLIPRSMVCAIGTTVLAQRNGSLIFLRCFCETA